VAPPEHWEVSPPPPRRRSFWQRLFSFGKGLTAVSAGLAPGAGMAAMPPTIVYVQTMTSQDNAAKQAQVADLAVRTTAGDMVPPPAMPNFFGKFHFPAATPERLMDATLVALMLKSTLDAGNILKLGFDFYDRFKRKPDAAEVEGMVAESDKRTSETLATAAAELASVGGFAEKVREVVQTKMTNLQQRILATYADPGLSDYDMKQQLERLKREYCSNILEIRQLNGNRLPAPVQEDWDQFACSKYAF
jgi:hypothetical protein